ncbi:unnamed protein product [Tetraodon nigroviridis]|uniref:triacylglycerol lipase n=1 Tax=Tetraodon nigroviridis TaxID=99883 RepID=Q4T9X3_TETNG|nr:unnamed protein product [Tetraodon nigroviridis]
MLDRELGAMLDREPGATLDPDQGWNLSLAGCGFSSVYYLGALSCFLDRVPQLVHGASRICGASSGCLVAAAVTVGIPLHGFCADVLDLARTARTRPLGVLHPAFGLLRRVRDALLDKLPADAHLRASGRLCVSLTRLADGRNLLVSQFDSREELVQVLLCSCFFPVYCGFVPPSYRGELFLDGALSNNLPLSEQRNTITMAPFRGESDICPKDDSFNPVQVHCCSLSVQVSSRNLHRICTSFLPPSVQNLAEICHSGYVDALRFLGAQGLITAPLPQPLSLEQPEPDQEPGQEPGRDPDLEPVHVLLSGLKPQLEPITAGCGPKGRGEPPGQLPESAVCSLQGGS